MFADGDIYDGQYVAGMRNGHGVYIHANGIKYDGPYKDDQKHGFGLVTMPDGKVFVSHFQLGSRVGSAVLYSWDDTDLDVQWQSGQDSATRQRMLQ